MNHEILAMLLLALGLALLVAEVFIPSGGMILIAAVICLGFAIVSAYYAWWEPSRELFWTYLVVVLFLLPAVLGATFYLLPRTPLGRALFAAPPSEEEVAPFAKEWDHLSSLVGKRGKTVTLLTPGGLVLVEGERMHCESEGMLIEPNEEVVVVRVKGNRLVVRRAGLPDERPPDAQEPDAVETAESDDSPLDFDLPKG